MEIVITSAEEECPTIFENEKFQNNLRSAARVKKYLEPEFISSCVMDQTGTQVMNKIKLVFYYYYLFIYFIFVYIFFCSR